MALAATFARVAATEITAWPPEVQAHAFALPLLSLPVGGTATTLALLHPVPDETEIDLFPKLGVKSWQETGRLRILRAGFPLEPSVAGLLATPSRQQVMLLQAWEPGALQLHLFPHHDFSAVAEARYLVSQGRCSLTSLCLRGALQSTWQQGISPEARQFAEQLAIGAAARLGAGSVIVQVAFEPSGRISILDINPALTPQDTAGLLDQSVAA